MGATNPTVRGRGTARRHHPGSFCFLGSTKSPRQSWLLLGELLEPGEHGSQFEQHPHPLQKHISGATAVPAPRVTDEEDGEVLSTPRVSALGAENTKAHPVRVGLTGMGCVGGRLAGRRCLFEAPCCCKEKQKSILRAAVAQEQGRRALRPATSCPAREEEILAL